MHMYMCCRMETGKRVSDYIHVCTHVHHPQDHMHVVLLIMHKSLVHVLSHMHLQGMAGTIKRWLWISLKQCFNTPASKSSTKVKIGSLHAAKLLTSSSDLPPRLSKNYLTAIWAASALGGLAGYRSLGYPPAFVPRPLENTLLCGLSC